MEKFGIFELLDALSAIAMPDPAEINTPNTQDQAYQPPAYSAENETRTDAVQADEEAPRPGSDALSGFYARHNAIARKATKKQ